jgi:hypothetical protein
MRVSWNGVGRLELKAAFLSCSIGICGRPIFGQPSSIWHGSYRGSRILVDEFDEGGTARTTSHRDRAPDSPGPWMILGSNAAPTRLFNIYKPVCHTVLVFTERRELCAAGGVCVQRVDCGHASQRFRKKPVAFQIDTESEVRPTLHGEAPA